MIEMYKLFRTMCVVVLIYTNINFVSSTMITTEEVEKIVSFATADLKSEIGVLKQKVYQLGEQQKAIEDVLLYRQWNTKKENTNENMTEVFEIPRNSSNTLLIIEDRDLTNKDLPVENIGFMVRKIPTQDHLSLHQVIEFTDVVNNFGNCYDTNFHFYSAPKPGLYYFTCTLTSYQTEILNFELAKNGAMVVKGYAADGDQTVCATVSAYLHMDKDDKVWIRNARNVGTTSNFKVYGNYYSTFLGFKVQ